FWRKDALCRRVSFDRAKGFGPNLPFGYAKSGKRGFDCLHHLRRSANMNPMGSNIRHGGAKERCIDMSPLAAPGLAARLAHRHNYPKIAIACFELSDLVPKYEIAWGPEPENQMHDARPAGLREIPRHTHHRRNSDTSANQHDAV